MLYSGPTTEVPKSASHMAIVGILLKVLFARSIHGSDHLTLPQIHDDGGLALGTTWETYKVRDSELHPDGQFLIART